MSNEMITRADHAEKLKENPVWVSIWSDLEKILNDQLLLCNTTKDHDLIIDIARCKQLAKMMQGRVDKYIENGKVEELRIEELRKKNSIQNLVRSFKR